MWSRMVGTVEKLGERGLIEMSSRKMADGTVEPFPLGLSAAGVKAA